MGNIHKDLMLHNELSRLSPDIFSHPVWLYFNETQLQYSKEFAREILSSIQPLISTGDPPSICQLLLICAALQKYIEDYPAALDSVQQAWILAENNDLPQVAQWAAWGSCAVCTLLGRLDKATLSLKWLRGKVSEKNDWVLANLLELIEFALCDQTQSNEDIGALLDWLRRWGDPPILIEGSNRSEKILAAAGKRLSGADRSPRFSLSSLRSIWITIKKIASGQLRLAWVENEKSSPDISKNTNEPSNHYISIHQAEFNTQQSAHLPTVPEIVHPPTNIDTNVPLLTISEGDSSSIVLPVQEVQDKFQLSFYCLGPFRVLQKGNLMENWPNRKALAILKYLVTHRQSPVPKDMLMNIFWPNADPVSARNRLNVAMHSLRREFRSITDLPIVIFEGDGYLINPIVELWVDIEEFERHFKTANQLEAKGQNSAAVNEFEVAASLYSDDFLVEDLYEEWPIVTREWLRVEYLEILDHLSQIYFDQGQYATCISLCSRILERDHCHEDAQCRLMRCYSRSGQPYLALRQYQICVDALRTELEVEPESATTKLSERIRRREQV